MDNVHMNKKKKKKPRDRFERKVNLGYSIIYRNRKKTRLYLAEAVHTITLIRDIGFCLLILPPPPIVATLMRFISTASRSNAENIMFKNWNTWGGGVK